MKIRGISFLSLSILLPVLSYAADLPLTTKIDSVTVHPYSAIVTRQGQLQIPAGEHRIVLENLPADLDPARLQFSLQNSNVRLGSMELNQLHHGDFTEEAERRIRDELQTLQDNRKVISDRIDTANLQLQLLSSLASGKDSASVKPTVNGNELATLLSTLSSNSEKARSDIRSATIELRKVDKAIEQKQFELNQVSTQRKTQTQLIVNVRADSAITAPVKIEYPQYNASWRWLYEARLDTTERKLVYNRQVSVAQNTGEDWSNVALTISTANNQQNTQTPDVYSLFIDLQSPQPTPPPTPAPVASKSRGFAEDSVLASPPMQEAMVTGARARRDEAVTVASQYLVDYQVPGRATVLANQQDKVLYVDSKSFDIQLVSRTVPEMDRSAYLEVRFTYKDEIPLQAGAVQLYRDGAFIGEGYSPTFLPGKDIRLPFGNDERIRVAVFNEAEESKEGGVFNRSSVEQLRTRFEITSYHAKPVDVEIVGRVPVSRNGKVTVEIPKQATPADEKELDGKAGVIMWKLAAQPQKVHAIKHYVDITYPKDAEIEYQ